MIVWHLYIPDASPEFPTPNSILGAACDELLEFFSDFCVSLSGRLTMPRNRLAAMKVFEI
jgi:hypothetical protein